LTIILARTMQNVLHQLQMIQNDRFEQTVNSVTTTNADFAGVERLTPEQRNKIQPFMDSVSEAERAFRVADDELLSRQKQHQATIAEAQQKLAAITKQRLVAANDFENNKKAFGVVIPPRLPTL